MEAPKLPINEVCPMIAGQICTATWCGGCNLHWVTTNFHALQLIPTCHATMHRSICLDSCNLVSNYSRSASDFRGFVNGIVAGGGRDGPEDIMGGLTAVFTHLCWRQDSTKVFCANLYHTTITTHTVQVCNMYLICCLK